MKQTTLPKVNKHHTSKVRKIYYGRFVIRCISLLIMAYMYFAERSKFAIIEGMGFFQGFSIFHILWLLWVGDMIVQLLPIKAHVSIGSQKHFLKNFKPIKEKINYENLKNYIITTTKSAYKIFLLWTLIICVIAILYAASIIDSATVFMITMVFYVGDLVCVLIWCPFRLIMKSKCCTTCRIFNWDHLMMFSPFIVIQGVYTQTLVILAFATWLLWEICIMMYPERFWEKSNVTLKCSECTDKLCTQYCRRLKSKVKSN